MSSFSGMTSSKVNSVIPSILWRRGFLFTRIWFWRRCLANLPTCMTFASVCYRKTCSWPRVTPLGELLLALIIRRSKNEWERLGLLASAHAKPSFYNMGDEQGQVRMMNSLVHEKRNISRLQKTQSLVTYTLAAPVRQRMVFRWVENRNGRLKEQ